MSLARLACLSLTLALLTTALHADESGVVGAPLPELPLREAVARALDRNFTLEIQRLTTAATALGADIAEAAFDPTVAITARTATNQAAAPGSVLDGVVRDGPRQESRNLRLSASQRVATGANITADAALVRGKTNSANALLNPAYDSDVALTVRQPLLRGFGTDYNRAAINRARLGRERAQHDFTAAVLDVVRDVETAYANLVFAREQWEVRRFSLRLAEQLLDENKARRETGVATDLEVLQAEVGVANAQRNLLQAERSAKDREDALVALIGQFEFDDALGSVGLPDREIEGLSLDRSYALARQQSPTHASLLASIEQLDIDARVARSNRRPTLDVGGTLGYNAKEASAGDAASRVWNGDGYAWQVDMALRFPWGFQEEKARLGQAQANLQREEARLRQFEQSLLVQVRAAVRAVETNRESVRISTLATRLSERQFDLEKARYDAGLAIFRRVQEAQEDLDTARVNELQAKVNLYSAQAELARIEANSLAHFGIVLQ
jgi:outer membrane protein